MKNNCTVYSLATKYKVLILVVSLLAFSIAFRLYGQDKYTYSALFFIVSIIVFATSTYQKRIQTEYSIKQLTIQKAFFGFCFSQLNIFVNDKSKFKLSEESSLGHQGGKSTRHLILSVTAHLKNDLNTHDIAIVSEHIDKNKGVFIEKAKVIADGMKLTLENES